MRARSAYISSVGTTTILVAAALLMLAIVSALVGFRGWPGDAVADSVTSVPLEAPPPEVVLDRVAEPVPVRVLASRAREVSAAASRGSADRPSTEGLVKVPQMRPGAGSGPIVHSPPPADGPPAAAPQPAPDPQPVVDAPERPAPDEPVAPLPSPSDVQTVVGGLLGSVPPLAGGGEGGVLDAVQPSLDLGDGVLLRTP